MHKTKIKIHLHRSSLHFSAIALAAISFWAANEHAVEAFHQVGKEVETIVSVTAERELPHSSISLGGPKMAVVAGGM